MHLILDGVAGLTFGTSMERWFGTWIIIMPPGKQLRPKTLGSTTPLVCSPNIKSELRAEEMPGNGFQHS